MDTELTGAASTQEGQLLVRRLLDEARALTGYDCVYVTQNGHIKAAKQLPQFGGNARGVFLRISAGKDGPTVHFEKTGIRRWELTTENVDRVSRQMKAEYQDGQPSHKETQSPNTWTGDL